MQLCLGVFLFLLVVQSLLMLLSPRTSSGKQYILVVCDYTTWYPEAISLRSIDALHIAEQLVTLFSRVGIPDEILTDQGSNFTSQLLTEIYHMLHIHTIQTTPYHSQTDGLVECFNQTLKAMLKKTAADEGKDWDKVIPYLLFVYLKHLIYRIHHLVCCVMLGRERSVRMRV